MRFQPAQRTPLATRPVALLATLLAIVVVWSEPSHSATEGQTSDPATSTPENSTLETSALETNALENSALGKSAAETSVQDPESKAHSHEHVAQAAQRVPHGLTAPNRTLTAVDGIQVGHDVLEGRPTGCTVILTEAGAVAGVDVRGSAPGSRELALLDPVHSVQQVHAVVLSGGSAFGLDTASGVMRFLEQKGVGFDVGVAKVPIVPAAILFDLGVGGAPGLRPDADSGFRAASRASRQPVSEGNVGAGAGATVGKLRGPERAMKGGLGSAALELANGLQIGALVAVNAVGDVIDPATGRVVAGVRDEQGRLADVRLLMREGQEQQQDPLDREAAGRNTTLAVVATNAQLNKAQATKLAQMAQDGLARAIVPAHTPWDGDTVFALATGQWQEQPQTVDLTLLGGLAAELTAEAIVRAVRAATSLPGLPAVRDLPSGQDAPASSESPSQNPGQSSSGTKDQLPQP